ncbi:hypothetical protein VW29_17805 [Devosia limi DSM 17137]|uniref:ATP-dependent Zn proteases n=1 Tax=Devosia limi DSM 17137 TaxID=1121477 RepID=A0A0F5LAV2_9HYPH|nr:AAA family ATPase [Devosia limi]KKB79415.1 hypothetical protein VW29_17805 [Devosia limi DSM 17137]SHF32316.1 ATP-dependent Zn proteases [Devosia limi DSM 17137]
MAEHEIDDDYDAAARFARDVLTKPPLHAGECLALEALRKALPRKAYEMTEHGPRVFIIQVPDAHWVEAVSKAVSTLAKSIVVKTAIERSSVSKVEVPVGADDLRHLQRGRSVAFISQDPTGILDPAVLAAADLTVTLRPIDAALLRKVIRQVSGNIARGVTAEMAALPLRAVINAIRPGLSARDCVANLSRSIVVAPMKAAPSSVPLLTELPLTVNMRRWADTTLADLSAVSAGHLGAEALVYGVLEGPPGTGKTLLAQSLAQTSGWNFVSSSVGQWFTTRDGALGGVARNIKDFIDTALASEPAVAFLDELDGLPDRAQLDARSRDWWTPVVTLCLTEIDRLRASGKSVLLLGGTNYFNRLDTALVRPGRLQNRISVLPPATREELAEVFRFYLGPDLPDTDLVALAQLGLGATPAMVQGWTKDARAVARGAGRSLALADLMAQVVPSDDRRPADIKAIALHEAGHALVAHRLGHAVDMISIISQGRTGGFVSSSLPTSVMTLGHVHDVATVMLAGRAADLTLGGGANTGAEHDIEQATRLLINAYEKQGLGAHLLYAPAMSARPLPATIATVSEDLDRLLGRAVAILNAERDLTQRMAKHLVGVQVMTGDEVLAFLGSHPIAPSLPLRSGHGDDYAASQACA